MEWVAVGGMGMRPLVCQDIRCNRNNTGKALCNWEVINYRSWPHNSTGQYLENTIKNYKHDNTFHWLGCPLPLYTGKSHGDQWTPLQLTVVGCQFRKYPWQRRRPGICVLGYVERAVWMTRARISKICIPAKMFFRWIQAVKVVGGCAKSFTELADVGTCRSLFTDVLIMRFIPIK